MTESLARSLDRIRACGVLPVVEIPDGTDPIALVDALLGARIDAIEITLRTAGAIDAIRAIRSARPDVLIAAGTVLTTDQVDAAVAAGADLVVSPGFSERVVDHALQRGANILPGVSTPTEVELGLGRGLGTFKFFPAEAAGGRRWLSAVGGPYPTIRFVPTGGIDAATLSGYLELPNVLACGGSWLVSRQLLEDGDMETVRRLAQEARIIVNRVRPGLEVPPAAPAL
jgi:2-dehydro-3-deoxyphosphogluconate aldolase / (4S)-4-hydroxy-2-oxoglutarate aldolase